jgi:hypothetical protein
MTRVRRTKAEIAAGLSHEDKLAGKNIILAEPEKTKRVRRTKAEIEAGISLEAKLVGKTIGVGVKPSAEDVEEAILNDPLLGEIADTQFNDANLELQQIAVKSHTNADKPKFIDPPPRRKTPQTTTTAYKVDKTEVNEDGDKTIYKSRETVREVFIDKPVVKEIRIVYGEEGSPITIEELIENKLTHISHYPHCEWTQLHMDKDFKASTQDKLGKAGWKFAYIMDWGHVKDAWKNKPHTIFYYRLKK